MPNLKPMYPGIAFSLQRFAAVDTYGYASNIAAGNTDGVRPGFCIF